MRSIISPGVKSSPGVARSAPRSNKSFWMRSQRGRREAMPSSVIRRQADGAVGFIDHADRVHARGVLGQARSVDQAGGAVVASARVNPVEADQGRFLAGHGQQDRADQHGGGLILDAVEHHLVLQQLVGRWRRSPSDRGPDRPWCCCRKATIPRTRLTTTMITSTTMIGMRSYVHSLGSLRLDPSEMPAGKCPPAKHRAIARPSSPARRRCASEGDPRRLASLRPSGLHQQRMMVPDRHRQAEQRLKQAVDMALRRTGRRRG